MAEIISLENMRHHMAARRGFQAWTRRFGEAFDETTCIRDLSDSTLGAMVQAGEQTTLAIHELIMGVMNIGKATEFNSLDNPRKLQVMDIAIFLLDQIRFECMQRLGWIEGYSAEGTPIVEMITRFASHSDTVRSQTPVLSPHHPRRQEYDEEFDGDRAAFVRRMIPDAIEKFLQKLRST